MVKVVTDSVADIPQNVVEELGISVIPLIVCFGDETYRDGIDMTADEFYQKLASSDVFPLTSAPSPKDFADTYDSLAEETEEIFVVSLTSKLSGSYNTALKSIELMKKKCSVEVFDSMTATMAQGFIAMESARAAQAGASLDEVRRVAEKTRSKVDFLCTFDTLEYLRRGGRIGAARAFLGSMLKVNPLITLRDGVVMPAGKTLSRVKAVEQLFEFVEGYSHLEEVAVEYTACRDDAERLTDKLSALYPREQVYLSKMAPVIGAHTGPGLLLVAVLGERS